ncbi:MAG: sulfatase-like hydrolase/transferase [Chthoniobacteraceae bacterium]
MTLSTYRLAVFALAAFSSTLIAAESGKPNILIIVADDLGYGELTVQGFTTEIPTPHIDSIAKAGVRFTSGYVSGPYCSPTRAALLTGRYQQRLGHEFNPGPATTAGTKVGLDVTQKTAGDRFKAAGYGTAWIGKSHLGYEPEFHPLKRGFDHYFGFLGGAHSYLDADGKGQDPVQRNGQPVPKIDYLTEEIGREAAGFIEKNKGQPWFTYLAFNAVHAPLEATDKYRERFGSITDPKRRSFAAMLSALDDAVGVVLAKLRDTGQEENTLVFFISDNGGPTPSITSGNGPLRGYKAQTWEGGVRVPWFVQWKGRIPSGKVDDRPVIQIDILPTALAAAGVTPEPESKIDGVNLLPFLTGEKVGAPHDALYWRFGQQIAIRKGDWKLVKGAPLAASSSVASTEGAQLYNLAKDIGEKTNLAEKEPEKLKELAAAWNEWNKENIAPKWTQGARAKKAAVPTTATSPTGPWKSGDALAGNAAPQVGGHGFEISARIDSTAPKGVILAQGGAANGYALFVHDGKLALALRVQRALTVITAEKPLEPGARKITAQLAADGKVTLSVDGEKVGEGKASLISKQPGEGLNVGGDGKNAVGEYEAPNEFGGKIENATVSLL